jgi:predicted transcriptional regulator
MSRLSREAIKQIIYLYNIETPILDIAPKVGVTKWAVYYQIHMYKKRGFIMKVSSCRKTKSEIQICTCDIQDCKGRFIAKKLNTYDVCPFEAIRRGYVSSISEYYK